MPYTTAIVSTATHRPIAPSQNNGPKRNSAGGAGAFLAAGAWAIMTKKKVAKKETTPTPIRTKYTAWSTSACSAWKAVNLDSLLIRKITRGAIHQATICSMWARSAIVRSSWVG